MSQYFWFLGVFLGPIFARKVYLEFLPVVEQNQELESAHRLLTISTGLLLSIPYVLIGACQVLGGMQNPGFVLTNNFHNKWVRLALGIVVLTHLAGLALFSNGQVAELISRLQYVKPSPTTVRIIAQALIVGSLAINLGAAYFNAGVIR